MNSSAAGKTLNVDSLDVGRTKWRALIGHGCDSIARDLIDRAVVRLDWCKPPPIQPNCGRTRGRDKRLQSGEHRGLLTTVTDAGKEITPTGKGDSGSSGASGWCGSIPRDGAFAFVARPLSAGEVDRSWPRPRPDPIGNGFASSLSPSPRACETRVVRAPSARWRCDGGAGHEAVSVAPSERPVNTLDWSVLCLLSPTRHKRTLAMSYRPCRR